jgi:hypothetical protein
VRIPFPVRGAGAVLLLAVLAAGCGRGGATPPRVDAAQVEGLLLQRQKERSPTLRFDAADCPEDVPARQGETFECSLEVEDQPVRVRVTITEVLGERTRYEFRPAKAIVDVVGVTNFIRSRLDEPWRLGVDCGPARARVLDIGGVIECTAFDGTFTRYIQAVVEDLDGTVTLQER